MKSSKLFRLFADGKGAKTLRLAVAKKKDGRQPLTSATGLPQQLPEGPDEINNSGSFLASCEGIASHIAFFTLILVFVKDTRLTRSYVCLRDAYNIQRLFGSDICALTVPLVVLLAVKGCVLSVAVNAQHR